jgi:hypothetical protein
VDYESEVDDDMIYIFRKGEVSTDLHFLFWIDKLKGSSSINAQFIFDHTGVLTKLSLTLTLSLDEINVDPTTLCGIHYKMWMLTCLFGHNLGESRFYVHYKLCIKMNIVAPGF